MRTLTTEQFRTLLEAFGASDASDAMGSGLDALRQLGIVEHQGAHDAWLTLEHAKDRVVLVSESAFDESSTAVVRQLVLTALQRVDEGRRVKLAEERLEMLSSASFEGIMIHVDGNIIDANKRLAELLGCEYEEVFGNWSIRNCVAPEDLADVHQRMASGYEGAYVITGVRKDGTRFR